MPTPSTGPSPTRGSAGTLSAPLADLLDRELRAGVRFFWERANTDPDSAGYGLVPDRAHPDPADDDGRSSVASVGFGLSAIAVGAVRGLIDPDAVRERVRGTLRTLARAEHWHGFWPHFLLMDSGERRDGSEFSTIDSALALNGAISAAQILDDPQITEQVDALLERVDWGALVFERDGVPLLHMAFNPDPRGSYANDADPSGLISAWDMTAEQLCMYLLAAGSPSVDPALAGALYAGFDRPLGTWGGEPFVHTPGGAMFIYQFSHIWLPFQRYVDADGFDWFENSRRAILANRQWCIDHSDRYRTLGPHLWGLTAGDGLPGYIVSGTPVREQTGRWPYCEGTVMPYSMVASLPFVPEIAGESLLELARAHPGAWGEYGFVDALNLEGDEPVYLTTTLGIDKGPAVLTIDNYLHQTTWDAYEAHPWIARALSRLGWTRTSADST